MGIPSFYGWIYRKYNNDKGTILMEDEISGISNIDHLFFDYNSMIHPCAHKVTSLAETEDDIEEAIIKEVILYTRYVMGLIQARNVYIMIDGVAPRAKINQQRERRYKSYMLKKMYEERMIWDSNKITPGTKFMKKIRDALDVFCKEQTQYNIYVSDSDVIGEGEHKMMEYINQQLTVINTDKSKICIYGLDADLIMLSMQCKRANDIILLRDNTFNTSMKDEQRTFTCLNIEKLRDAIYAEVKSQSNDGNAEILNKSNAIRDFIFICFLLGNDFLEHIPSLIIKESGVNVLLKSYMDSLRVFKSPLILPHKHLSERINLPFLVDLLQRLAKVEDYFFRHIYNKKRHEYKDVYNLEEMDETKLSILNVDVIKFNEPGYKQRYYNFNGVVDIDLICRDYIEGLYWVTGYYEFHKMVNWAWYYRHDASPFISDLYKYVKGAAARELPTFIEESIFLRNTECGVLSQKQQLLMVLPRESLKHIMDEDSKCLERIFRTTDSYHLEMMFPQKLSLNMMNKEYMWQSRVMFREFDDKVYSLFLQYI